jgi:acyl carrier protein
MDRNAIQKEIIVFVCRNFLVGEEEINLEESLVDQGIIDSFGLVEIATFLKKQFGAAAEPAEMNRDNFGSIVRMAAFVERKTHG